MLGKKPVGFIWACKFQQGSTGRDSHGYTLRIILKSSLLYFWFKSKSRLRAPGPLGFTHAALGGLCALFSDSVANWKGYIYLQSGRKCPISLFPHENPLVHFISVLSQALGGGGGAGSEIYLTVKIVDQPTQSIYHLRNKTFNNKGSQEKNSNTER